MIILYSTYRFYLINEYRLMLLEAGLKRHKSTITYVIPSSDEQTSYFVSLRSFRSKANVNIKPSIANTISIISDQ